MRPYSIDPAITVRVEKPSGKMPKIPGHNRALSRLQVDCAQVLSALPVLREEAWPCGERLITSTHPTFCWVLTFVVGPDAGGTDKTELDTWRALLVPRVGFEPTLHGF
jgi:hypothetical protein